MADSLQKSFEQILRAAFRWAVRLNYHEGVANHFSVAINDSGSQFLINPNQRHFCHNQGQRFIAFRYQ